MPTRLTHQFTAAATMLAVIGAVQAASNSMPTDAQLIASAMRAAPARVAKDATIVATGADGTMRTLRQGTNAFTCMPDNPTTPGPDRSEEHTSELQSLMRNSYAVFCLKNKKYNTKHTKHST